MEPFSGDPVSTSYWDHFVFLLLRPTIAVVFSISVLLFGWFLAWKLVLVHVPLVQEIFGLRKKPVRPKPAGRRRFTQFYNRINAQNQILELNPLQNSAGD
ncbi:FAD-binding Berberine family protein [Striga asiatica]|uniref:FAD-binding Berberine family protein n=1 Tax=Striga asiatica TaxID=4170 RepID=A0A5A7Q301_STRAF|nr:FAD-binding Berberine family protein [Striga asiatica]